MYWMKLMNAEHKYRVPMPPGKSWNFYWKISRTWKVLENDLGPGKSWNLLGSDVHGSFRFQIDMFMQTKIAIIVAIRYVFWAAVMPKMLSWSGFLPVLRWQCLQLSHRLPSCCFLLYLNMVGLRWGPGKCSWRPGKVLDFFVTKTVGTL